VGVLTSAGGEKIWWRNYSSVSRWKGREQTKSGGRGLPVQGAGDFWVEEREKGLGEGTFSQGKYSSWSMVLGRET